MSSCSSCLSLQPGKNIQLCHVIFYFRLEKRYTGFIKLKQNWDDGLRKKTNPKTLILAGNIESAVGYISKFIVCVHGRNYKKDNKNSFKSFLL